MVLHFPKPEKRPFDNKRYVSLVVLVLVFFSFIFGPIPVFGQGAPRVPNIQDQSEGWVFNNFQTEYRFFPKKTDGNRFYGHVLRIRVEVYTNSNLQMIAHVYSWVNKDGTKDEFEILYSSETAGRFAINIDGKWYPAIGLYTQDQNAFKFDSLVVKGDLPVQVKISLQTIEGLKSRVIKLDK